jgi:hypothetical protein
MAPIREETVTDLKDLVAKLETRVRQLEDRFGGEGAKSRTPSQSMRMILMGPPGAGKPKPELRSHWLPLNYHRQGHASTQDQRKILRLSSGMERALYLARWAILIDSCKGNRRHATRPGRKENRPRPGSKEDYGSRRACERRYHGQYDQVRTGYESRLRERVYMVHMPFKRAHVI